MVKPFVNFGGRAEGGASTNKAVRPNTGACASEAEAVSAMVAELVSELDPQSIWLFGSRARGEARVDSDFDLLVVAKPGQDFGEDDFATVYRPVAKLGIGADVVPCDMETFQASLDLRTSFVRRIVDEGRLLYERAAQ